jgi:hypothetical protein
MPGQIPPWCICRIGVLTLLVTDNLIVISALGPRVSSNNWKMLVSFYKQKVRQCHQEKVKNINLRTSTKGAKNARPNTTLVHSSHWCFNSISN